MCGIVGYTGSDIAKNILVTGLKRMEYRGYDSSGVALEVGEGAAAHLDVVRRVGKVAGLESELSNIDSDATCGIGHTRWATHGKPSEANAHPHTSCSGDIAVVHNGIIENFAELREELEGRGHHFKSETDTEVFAHLIERGLCRDARPDGLRARGLRPWSVPMVWPSCALTSQRVIAVARKDSPIVVGAGETGAYVASDVIALIDATRDVVVLEDGQFAKLTPAGVEYTDEAGNVIEPKVTHIDWDLDMAEKGGYPDFMLKEIHEQPRVVRDTLVGRMTPAGELDIDELGLSLEELNDIDRVYVIACGTSYHAGLIAKNLIEGWARIPTEVEAASEFRYRNPIITP
ncbi:MAG: isomerizing glutamine--fructose-6-phosphate transaminase, partial [Collinsella sp.]